MRAVDSRQTNLEGLNGFDYFVGLLVHIISGGFVHGEKRKELLIRFLVTTGA